MTEVARVETKLDDATQLLDEVRAAIGDGRTVDLDAFNDVIQDACDAAIALPPEEVRAVRGKLDTLFTRLNETKNDLEALSAEATRRADAADTAIEAERAAESATVVRDSQVSDSPVSNGGAEGDETSPR